MKAPPLKPSSTRQQNNIPDERQRVGLHPAGRRRRFGEHSFPLRDFQELEESVLPVERLAGEEHLREQAVVLSLHLEMNVRRAHPDDERGVRAGLDGLKTITP